MPMQDRIRMIRKGLRLEPHPEGGYYRQVFKSARTVQPGDSRPERGALTAIYFLLIEGQCSRWHSVQSDEVWNHLEGGTLELSCYDAAADRLTQLKLGPYGPGVESVTAVPAGMWQAANPLGAYVLAGCVVGPGFEFSDFRLAADDEVVSKAIRSLGAQYEALL